MLKLKGVGEEVECEDIGEEGEKEHFIWNMEEGKVTHGDDGIDNAPTEVRDVVGEVEGADTSTKV